MRQGPGGFRVEEVVRKVEVAGVVGEGGRAGGREGLPADLGKLASGIPTVPWMQLSGSPSIASCTSP